MSNQRNTGRNPLRRVTGIHPNNLEGTRVMKLLAAKNLQQSVQDRILMLLQAGHQPDDVFKDIYVQCALSIETKAQKQELADYIAVMDRCFVGAVGSIPEGLEELES
jgi:hypothetical protein